jgi:hypothetical protein
MNPEIDRLELLLASGLGYVRSLNVKEETVFTPTATLWALRSECGGIKSLTSARVDLRVMPTLWHVSIPNAAETPGFEVSISCVDVASGWYYDLVERGRVARGRLASSS